MAFLIKKPPSQQGTLLLRSRDGTVQSDAIPFTYTPEKDGVTIDQLLTHEQIMHHEVLVRDVDAYLYDAAGEFMCVVHIQMNPVHVAAGDTFRLNLNITGGTQ